jgi:hypothetical protein
MDPSAFLAQDLPEHGQSEPQKEDKLEDEVEGEPVDNVDEALSDATRIIG